MLRGFILMLTLLVSTASYAAQRKLSSDMDAAVLKQVELPYLKVSRGLCRAVERATAWPMRGSFSKPVQRLAVRGLSRPGARPDAPSAVRQRRGCLLKTGADSGSMKMALAPIPLGHHAMDMGANKSLSVKA